MTAPTQCPGWCAGEHEGEPRHLASLRSVGMSLVPGEARLWIDLTQGVDDPEPVIVLHVEEDVVARLKVSEAVSMALRTIGLAQLVIEG